MSINPTINSNPKIKNLSRTQKPGNIVLTPLVNQKKVSNTAGSGVSEDKLKKMGKVESESKVAKDLKEWVVRDISTPEFGYSKQHQDLLCTRPTQARSPSPERFRPLQTSPFTNQHLNFNIPNLKHAAPDPLKLHQPLRDKDHTNLTSIHHHQSSNLHHSNQLHLNIHGVSPTNNTNTHTEANAYNMNMNMNMTTSSYSNGMYPKARSFLIYDNTHGLKQVNTQYQNPYHHNVNNLTGTPTMQNNFVNNTQLPNADIRIENRRHHTTDKRLIPSITKIKYDRNTNLIDNHQYNQFYVNNTTHKAKIIDK